MTRLMYSRRAGGTAMTMSPSPVLGQTRHCALPGVERADPTPAVRLLVTSPVATSSWASSIRSGCRTASEPGVADTPSRIRASRGSRRPVDLLPWRCLASGAGGGFFESLIRCASITTRPEPRGGRRQVRCPAPRACWRHSAAAGRAVSSRSVGRRRKVHPRVLHVDALEEPCDAFETPLGGETPGVSARAVNGRRAALGAVALGEAALPRTAPMPVERVLMRSMLHKSEPLR